MRFALALLLIVFGSPIIKAVPYAYDALTLSDGTVLRRVKVVRVSLGEIEVRHAGGERVIKFAELHSQLAAQYAALVAPPKSSIASLPLPRAPSAPAIAPPVPHLTLTAKPYHQRVKSFTIKGQIYITVKVGGAIKLSGVEVCLYPLHQFVKHMQAIDDAYAPLINYLQNRWDVAHDTAALGRISQIHYTQWSALPPPIASCTTNGDGQFEISTKIDEPWVLFVRSYRDIGDGPEYFVRWVISPKIKDPQWVMIH